jgi:hypothetical protein
MNEYKRGLFTPTNKIVATYTPCSQIVNKSDLKVLLLMFEPYHFSNVDIFSRVVVDV